MFSLNASLFVYKSPCIDCCTYRGGSKFLPSLASVNLLIFSSLQLMSLFLWRSSSSSVTRPAVCKNLSQAFVDLGTLLFGFLLMAISGARVVSDRIHCTCRAKTKKTFENYIEHSAQQKSSKNHLLCDFYSGRVRQIFLFYHKQVCLMAGRKLLATLLLAEPFWKSRRSVFLYEHSLASKRFQIIPKLVLTTSFLTAFSAGCMTTFMLS